MKSILLLFCILSGLSIHAQKKCSFNRVAARIGVFKSGPRISQYKRHKFKCLNDAKERLKITLTTSAFIELLKTVNDTLAGVHKYDGLRAYFAIDQNKGDSEYDKMTMVFVPTTYISDGEHRDVLQKCMVLKENDKQVTPLPQDIASKWVKAFQMGGKYAKLNEDGRKRRKHKYDSTYDETKSLWYDRTVLSDDEKDDGLLHYLNCASTKIKEVHLKFGGFGTFRNKSPYAYHLTIIFGVKRNHGKETDLSFTQKRNKDKKHPLTGAREPNDLFTEKLKILGEGNADTGIPCPPLPSGATVCPGTLLPLD